MLQILIQHHGVGRPNLYPFSYRIYKDHHGGIRTVNVSQEPFMDPRVSTDSKLSAVFSQVRDFFTPKSVTSFFGHGSDEELSRFSVWQRNTAIFLQVCQIFSLCRVTNEFIYQIGRFLWSFSWTEAVNLMLNKQCLRDL